MAVAVLSPVASSGIAVVVSWDHDGAAIRIQQQFRRIETKATRGIEWAINSQSVDLAGLHTWHEYVPVVISAVSYRIDGDNARGTAVIFMIEEEQVDAGSAAREEREVHTSANGCCAQRMTPTSLNNGWIRNYFMFGDDDETPMAHHRPSISLANSTTLSGSKPNLR